MEAGRGRDVSGDVVKNMITNLDNVGDDFHLAMRMRTCHTVREICQVCSILATVYWQGIARDGEKRGTNQAGLPRASE